MQHSNPTTTPLECGTILQKTTEEDKKSDAEHYHQIIDSLMYLAVYTCPDISYIVSKLSQYNSNPSVIHLELQNEFFDTLKAQSEFFALLFTI